MNKRLSLRNLIRVSRQLGAQGKRIVFTNGCFDLVHAGHVHILAEAKKWGDVLVVGINADLSVRRLKGKTRPICNLEERIAVIEALEVVDYVIPFVEDTPIGLINALRPDVLAKGGDWETDAIVGRQLVEERGGKAVSLGFLPGISTTAVIDRIITSHTGEE